MAKLEENDIGEETVRIVFTPVIEYRFTLGGVSRVSRKVAMCPVHPGSRESAEVVLRRYKVGSSVRVFCSPHDSEVTVLEPGLRWPSVGKLLVALMLLAAGAAMLWFFRESESSRVPL